MFRLINTVHKHITGITLVSYLAVLLSLTLPPCVLAEQATANTQHGCCHESWKDKTAPCRHDCSKDHCDTCEVGDVEITMDKFIFNFNEFKFKNNDYPPANNYVLLIDLRTHVLNLSNKLHEKIYPPLHPLIKYRHLLI